MDKRTRLYTQLLDSSKQQREANIADHKLRTSRMKHALRRRRELQATRKETPVPKIPLDFLAIGDSWFEYPLYNEIISFQNNAIVAPSQLGSMGNPPPKILNPGAARPSNDSHAVLGKSGPNDYSPAGS